MAKITLLLDEDVRVLLAEILRQRGYDVVHVLEVGRGGKSDPEQLLYAVSQKRVILSHNIRDYRPRGMISPGNFDFFSRPASLR